MMAVHRPHANPPRHWLAGASGLILIFLMAPSIIVVVMSFSESRYLAFPPQELGTTWYRNFFGSADWLTALWMSLRVATLTMILATLSGTMAALALYGKKGGLWAVLRGLLMAPAVVPVILIGVSLFMLYAPLRMNNSLTGIVIAHTVLALPFVIITVGSGLETFDFALKRAAISLGAPPLFVFRTVTLPQIKASVVAAALFAFLTSFDEAVVALYLTNGTRATLAQKMFQSLRNDMDPTIAAISTIMISVTTVAFFATILLNRKRA